MGAGAVVAAADKQNYADLIDKSRPWWQNRRLLALNGWILLLLITSSTNGYDGSMMNGLQSLPQWVLYFHNPSGGMLGLLNAIQNIGCLCAYPFSPYVTDGLGRRTAILIGATIMLIATAIQTASNSVHMFIGARFLIGFGLTFAAAAAPLLVTEIAYPSQRGQATSMYNTLWYFGSIVAAWTTFGTFTIPSSWAWRIPSLLQGLPSLIQLFLIWFVPESPRWLVRKGRETQALRTLAYYHANGNEQDPLVEYEFEEIKTAIKLDQEVSTNVGWLSLVKTPGNRRRMRIILALAFFSQWSGNGLVSYYLKRVCDSVGITDPTTQLLINGILNIFNFFVAIIAGLLCDKAGRRKLFIISTVGMLVFWTVQTICFSLYAQHGNPAVGRAVIGFIFVYYLFYDLAFTPLIVSYSVEILPYSIRAKGFVVFNFAVSASVVFNQYVNPIALNALGWKYYLVYVCWLAFEAVFVFIFVIETKNRTLEETAALFDGAEQAEQIAQHAAEVAKASEEDEKAGSIEVVNAKSEDSI
ncbi:general substrate transporter [Dentipellis sp. KUC8613]|nr:general substrate transporter [Dentipellis sp. KUC8613]